MTRSDFHSLMKEGLNTVFGMEYDEYPEEYSQVFETKKSKKAQEEDALIVGFGPANEKNEGGTPGYQKGFEAWTARYIHDEVSVAFDVTEVAIEDNNYFEMGEKYSRASARSMRETKEIKCISILNNGFNVNHKGGDGKPLFANDHPLAGGGTMTNVMDNADFSEKSLEEMLIMIRTTKDDRGLPVAIRAKDVVLPPHEEYNGYRILQSTGRVGTSDNDANAIKGKGIFTRDPVIMTRLTDADAWFVTTTANDGLKYYQRIPLQKRTWTDPKTGNHNKLFRERYSAGFTDPRGAFGSRGNT